MTECTKQSIPGYEFGSLQSAKSRLSMEELRQLEQTLGWTGEDERLLRKHIEFSRSQAESMVDAWRAVIGAQPHLAQWFVGPDGNPDNEYKARVKGRFVQWVVDVAARTHDQAWLDYQEEIGLRHTPQKKNKTDESHTPANVPLRYLIAFVPVVTDIRRFLAAVIEGAAELAAVESAWTKAVHLHVTLWSRPYAKEGLW
jgi:Protoglobin